MVETLRHDLHLAFVLHSRAYRETSLLLDLFSPEYGRIAMIARGAKRGKSKASAILQPFIPLNLSWYGNGELVTLTQVEQFAPAYNLTTKHVICGLYINELLSKLMHKWDPSPDLFSAYQNALLELSNTTAVAQAILRKFEKQLLKSIGYGLQLTQDIASGATVDPQQYYVLDPVLGPRLATKQHLDATKGSSLLALAADDYTSAEMLADSKRLMRLVFSYHLGARALVSRQIIVG